MTKQKSIASNTRSKRSQNAKGPSPVPTPKRDKKKCPKVLTSPVVRYDPTASIFCEPQMDFFNLKTNYLLVKQLHFLEHPDDPKDNPNLEAVIRRRTRLNAPKEELQDGETDNSIEKAMISIYGVRGFFPSKRDASTFEEEEYALKKAIEALRKKK